jgi:hypothetical protein
MKRAASERDSIGNIDKSGSAAKKAKANPLLFIVPKVVLEDKNPTLTQPNYHSVTQVLNSPS